MLTGHYKTLKTTFVLKSPRKIIPIKSPRSTTLLNGFKSELTARKDAISNAKTALESTYAKTLGKSEKQIQEDPGLVSEITTNIATIESAFNSFNGTVKTIKMSIESGLTICFCICLSNQKKYNPQTNYRDRVG